MPESVFDAQFFDRKYDYHEELKLEPISDPSRDLRAERDYEIPPWTPENFTSDHSAPGAAFSDNTGPRELYDARRRHTFLTPHFRSIRSLDPAGNITYLVVSTCRPTSANNNGDDGLGSEYRIRALKSGLGWLHMEDDDNFAGKEGDAYFRWLFAVRDFRRARYEADQRRQSAEFADRNAAAQREQSRMAMDAIEKHGEMTSATMQQMIAQLTLAVQALGDRDEKPRGKSRGE
jgi:hypothetical protein